MKKSKVLIPAMALLLFSTAASITGTVAWFSSTRVFDTSVGNFAVRELDGNLTCTMGADVGTTLSDNVVSVPSGNYLLDASYNASNSSSIDIYRKSREATPSEYFTKYTKGASLGQWLYRTVSTDNYFLAVSWTMTFTYDFNTETAPLDIFLDLKQSQFTGATALGANETYDTALGFRIAFIAGTNITVWGNRSLGGSGSEYADIKHVTGIAQSAVTSYSASNYVVHDNGYSTAGVSEGVAHSQTEKICSITNTAGTGSTTVTCVAWFEGTDPDVVSSDDAENQVKLQTLGADMFFFGRSANA